MPIRTLVIVMYDVCCIRQRSLSSFLLKISEILLSLTQSGTFLLIHFKGVFRAAVSKRNRTYPMKNERQQNSTNIPARSCHLRLRDRESMSSCTDSPPVKNSQVGNKRRYVNFAWKSPGLGTVKISASAHSK